MAGKVNEDNKDKDAYITTGQCVFKGVWYNYGSIILLDKNEKPNHAKLKKFTGTITGNIGKIYDPMNDSMQESDIDKALAGILK